MRAALTSRPTRHVPRLLVARLVVLLIAPALASCSSASGSDGPAAPEAPASSNQPPRIQGLTPSQESLAAETDRPLTFEVSAVDPEGAPLAFEFRLDGERVSTDSRYVFTASGEGSHELELTVSDGSQRVTRRWAITVVPDAAHAPLPSLAVQPDSGAAPLAVTILATATDVDGVIARWELDADGDGAFETAGAQPPATARTFDVPGTYRLRLRVTDDDGLAAVAERVIRVGSNQPPRAELQVTPSEGPAPLSVRVRGSGNDPEGALIGVELDLDGDGRYDVSASSSIDTTLVYADVSRSTTLALRATDASGASAVARATVTPRPDVSAGASTLTQEGTGRLLSDGKAVRRITARIVDSGGRPVPGVEVVLSSSRNGGVRGTVDRFEPSRGTTGASGELTTELSTNSSSVLDGDATIHATAGGKELVSTVLVQFVTPVNTFNSSLTCPFGPVRVRTSKSEPRQAVIVAEVRDAQDRPLPDMWVELKTRDAAIWPVDPPAGWSDASGRFQATVTSDRANDNTYVDLVADGYRTSAVCVVSFLP